MPSLASERLTMRLSPELHAHIIGMQVKVDLIDKYMRGAKEHKGHIHDLSVIQLIDMAMEEAIDEFVYLYTIKEKLVAKQDLEKPKKKPTI